METLLAIIITVTIYFVADKAEETPTPIDNIAVEIVTRELCEQGKIDDPTLCKGVDQNATR